MTLSRTATAAAVAMAVASHAAAVSPMSLVAMRDGDVVLLNSTNAYEGNVYVMHNQQLRPVCDSGWDQVRACARACVSIARSRPPAMARVP